MIIGFEPSTDFLQPLKCRRPIEKLAFPHFVVRFFVEFRTVIDRVSSRLWSSFIWFVIEFFSSFVWFVVELIVDSLNCEEDYVKKNNCNFLEKKYGTDPFVKYKKKENI